ncbi:MarR family winged helix-turn-helix transcriptional regulator [Novosphingobium sp. ZW T3_23]|uniref:MarR family winged helix-turn-helix transcriptional regulator n=1 Tax=Novosphingobium sp. ZW T3_23 TaxID=3378084 RepID=UPI003853568C
MELDLTSAALLALRKILDAAELENRKMAASTGLTPSQALVLRQVAEHASITPSAVAQTLKFSQATITNITDRLVSANLVTRTRSQSDKRQVMLQVTELGREKLRASPFPLQMRFSQAFAGLETWEQAMMLASLERLNTLLSPSPSGSP